MTRDWKQTFGEWAKPFSERDEEKASNAARMINEAIREFPDFKGKTIDVYPSGSYYNNTNTRKESDVDVAVVLKDALFYDVPPHLTPEAVGLTGRPAAYGFESFRDDVGRALQAKFKKGVQPGDKAFDVHETSYRLDADVAVFLEYRRYSGAVAGGRWHYDEGVEMRPRKEPAKRIVNWHRQHYEEGVKRNTATKRRFKRIVRILKRLRDDMRDSGTNDAKAAAAGIPSFLIECLVFNSPDACFNLSDDAYVQDTRAVLKNLREGLEPSIFEPRGQSSASASFVEVSRLKPLFGSTQPWTRERACEFVKAAWRHADL